MKSISAIHPVITENTENMRAPQRLIYFSCLFCVGRFARKNGWSTSQGFTLISQYASYSAMFCPLHGNISKEQHEKQLCNPSSHCRNAENIFMKRAPISIRESHNASISEMSILFHNIERKQGIA